MDLDLEELEICHTCLTTRFMIILISIPPRSPFFVVIKDCLEMNRAEAKQCTINRQTKETRLIFSEYQVRGECVQEHKN